MFKEKLKKLKVDLKVWNKEVFGNVNSVGTILQKRISVLDARDDEDDLDKVMREERILFLVEQSRNSFRQEAILHQKAHLK